MDERVRELIAIGSSISANCLPCLEYHLKKAKEYGATGEEISEAIAVGKVVRRGAAGKMDRYVLSVSPSSGATASCEDPSCECN